MPVKHFQFWKYKCPCKAILHEAKWWGSMSRIKCHLCGQWHWTMTLICNDWRQQQELLSLAQQCVLSLVHHWLQSLAQQSLLSLAQQALLSLAQQELLNWPKIYKFASSLPLIVFAKAHHLAGKFTTYHNVECIYKLVCYRYFTICRYTRENCKGYAIYFWGQ